MRRVVASVSFLCLSLFASGCATTDHFSKLPKPEEFAKPISQLKAEYPDLSRKESIWSSLTIFGCPDAQELKDAWGEPHDTGFTFHMLMPTNWIFHPSNYWYWHFEDKKLEALIDRPLAFGYRPHVVTLEIKDSK